MIDHTIRDYVAKNAPSLIEINTGGGIDYFGKQLETGQWVIVAAEDDAGSPEGVEQEASIYIWLDDDWMEWIKIWFPSAREAYIACHCMEGDSA